MDEQSKATLEALLATDVNALTDEDKAFLRARSSYIPAYQQEVYADVLNQIEEATAETETSTEEPNSIEEKPKKAKKAKES